MTPRVDCAKFRMQCRSRGSTTGGGRIRGEAQVEPQLRVAAVSLWEEEAQAGRSGVLAGSGGVRNKTQARGKTNAGEKMGCEVEQDCVGRTGNEIAVAPLVYPDFPSAAGARANSITSAAYDDVALIRPPALPAACDAVNEIDPGWPCRVACCETVTGPIAPEEPISPAVVCTSTLPTSERGYLRLSREHSQGDPS